MSYEAKFKPSAFAELQRLPRSAQQQIIGRIESLLENPHPPWSQPLKEERGLFRARSGDYRIVYTVRRKVVWVLKVADRKDVYRALESIRRFARKLAP